jgi:Protein of unknown function (DUF3455)
MKTSNWSRAAWAPIYVVGIVLSGGCTAVVAEPLAGDADELSTACEPQVPPVLAVPEGNKLAFVYDAVGVQIYGCDATATGYGWVFRAPEATLYGHKGKQTGTHYAGPTWEAKDGSTVVGTKLAEHAAGPNDIPLLLLGAASHAGKGRMTDITFIHRLETAGGKAPAAGCDATHVGETARVDYAATYYFYEARGKKK